MPALKPIIASLVLLGMAGHSSAGAAPACPVLKARYVLKADASFTAGFAASARGKADLLWVASAKTGATYWFLMDIGNGYTDTYLYAVADPATTGGEARQLKQADDLITISLYEMDENLAVASQPAAGLATAPRYLFAPALGINLYYFSSVFGRSANDREVMPRSLFELASCDGLA